MCHFLPNQNVSKSSTKAPKMSNNPCRASVEFLSKPHRNLTPKTPLSKCNWSSVPLYQNVISLCSSKQFLFSLQSPCFPQKNILHSFPEQVEQVEQVKLQNIYTHACVCVCMYKSTCSTCSTYSCQFLHSPILSIRNKYWVPSLEGWRAWWSPPPQCKH